MSAHHAQKGFMSNYLLWHQHGEVQPAVADESDGNDDINQMDNIVADIGRGYDLESEDPPPKVQNFYRLHRGKLPRVPWATGYGPKLQDMIGSLQRHMAREPHTPYQEVTLPLQAKEMGPPN
jgi:hypothetical protein